MIYLLVGIAIIALTNLGTLSIIMHFIDKDMREEHQRSQTKRRSQKKRSSRKRVQTKTKKRRRS